ncbi:MAG TPA: ATP-binding protein [Gammaproteobacteria bacterium]|nr:ATP-binding protein [Gammaproteobacteria bacterium]
MRDHTEVENGAPPLAPEAAAIDRLRALNAKLFRAPDAAAVLAETMDAARTLLRADMSSAELYDQQSDCLELVAQRGFSVELPPDKRSVKAGNGSVCALALAARSQVVLEDLLAEPRCAAVHAAARAAGIRGALATPITDHDGAVIAVISAYFKRPHLPTDTELRILDLLIQQATHLLERFHAEEALRRSEQQFTALFEQAACGIASVHPDERIALVNDRFCEIVGRTREQLLGKRIRDITHPDDVTRSVQLFEDAKKDGRSYTAEKRYVRPDGSIVWVSIDVSSLSMGRGAPLATMGICQDITSRKQTEDALREADRRKDEFLATLAHELRNPLSPIVNGLELLTAVGRDPEFFEDIHGILTRQARHMVRLVDDLLDVSRITRGKIELRKDRVDMAAVVKSAVETARPGIDAAGHRLQVMLPQHPLIVEADASRLSQVLSNLLNNAAKFMEHGGEITIAAERDGNDAVVRVIDRGIGIPQHLLERIFDLFTQADTSLERPHSGLGVGLTISKRLVELHGGSIVAWSEGPGRGSEFAVRLALDPVQALDGESDDYPNGDVTPRRVLVIDDNAAVLKSLCLLLRTLGHDVRGANDGRAALALGAEFEPEAVLLDLAMPNCNGYDTAALIRGQPWGRNALLVALTGWGQEEHRQRTKQAGFDRHFVKPIEGWQLQALLAKLGK